jgi:hypothetical protein
MSKGKLSGWIHAAGIIISMISAVAAYAAYSGTLTPADRLVSIEMKQDKMADDIVTIKEGQSAVKQSVDDLKNYWMRGQ